jgi:hypothetical protein
MHLESPSLLLLARALVGVRAAQIYHATRLAAPIARFAAMQRALRSHASRSQSPSALELAAEQTLRVSARVGAGQKCGSIACCNPPPV